MSPAVGRVLLISPDGMLGRAWVERLKADGIEHGVATFPEFDLTRPTSFDQLDLDGVTHIVNCAGWTDVDGAEAEEEAATSVNGAGVGALGRLAATRDIDLVHYSTDYVFSGEATEPYPVDAPLQPVNAYGRSKAAGERAIVGSGARHLIVRTSWLYAPWGGNFVRTMARLGGERDSLRVVDDQRGRPTSCEHLATTTLALMRAGAHGVHHVTDGGACTWFELATRVISRLHPNCRVDPCTSEEFPRPARRPTYSVLDLTPTEAIVGPMPAWTANVDAVVDRLE